MQLHELFDKHRINRAYVASRMGMPVGTFNNKMNPNHTTMFSGVENVELLKVLDDIAKDIKCYISTP